MNDVDKCVTESIVTKERRHSLRKSVAKLKLRQETTVTLTSVSIPVLERKWIDIETQRSHDHKCLDDMIKQSLEEVTEQSSTMTSSKSAGRKSSIDLRNNHLQIGYQLWLKQEELRTYINIA